MKVPVSQINNGPFTVPVEGYIKKCPVCGRAIMVECALMGASHNLSVFATCWDCTSEETRSKARKLYGEDFGGVL